MPMLIPDKKKAASIIISRMRPSEEGEMQEVENKEVEAEEQQEADMGLQAAAERMIQAMKSEDAASMVDAMKNMFRMMEMEEDRGE